jgi:flagellar motor switch protein FliM
MELINERFARYLRIGLFNYMHRNVEVSVGPIKVQKFSEFVRNLVVPTNLNLLTAKPLRGTGLVVLDPNLVFLVVDNLFGGDGRFHTRVEGRDFTPTEQRIIQGLLKVTFDEYAKAWAPVQKLDFEYVRSEMNPQFANIATPSEIVVACVLHAGIRRLPGRDALLLPYSMLEPIRETLYSTMQSDHITQDNRWVSMMGKQLQSAEVTLTAHLGTTRVTLRDIVNMRPGDVIPLNIPKPSRPRWTASRSWNAATASSAANTPSRWNASSPRKTKPRRPARSKPCPKPTPPTTTRSATTTGPPPCRSRPPPRA